VPSLDLRFADNKSLTDAVTGASLVTFTRASSGTYVDSAGVLQTAATDVPRFDHNPTTGESLGLLVEEQRTNLLVRSEEFNNASWTKAGGGTGSAAVVTANAGQAPDGTTTADRIELNQGAGTTLSDFSQVQQGVTLSAAGVSSFSVWLRSNDANNYSVAIRITDTSTIQTVSVTSAWRRFVVTTTGSASASIAVQLILRGTYGTSNTADILAWGAQLEAGASPTSYIPTTTAAVTRNADVASITGSAFSSWYQSGVGSLYGETISRSSGQVDSGGTAIGVAVLSDGTNDNRIRLGAIGTQAIWIAATNTEALLTSGTYTAGASFKLAAAYAVNDFAFTKDAATVQVDTSGVVPTVSQLNIGRSNAASGLLTGTISRLCYWNQRLSNASLQQITQ
jgi:hypothetical protein